MEKEQFRFNYDHWITVNKETELKPVIRLEGQKEIPIIKKEVRVEYTSDYATAEIHYACRTKTEISYELAVFSNIKKEWLVFKNRPATKKEDYDRYHGPFKADDYTARKIAEAYNLDKSKINLEEILKTSPEDLERIKNGYTTKIGEKWIL